MRHLLLFLVFCAALPLLLLSPRGLDRTARAQDVEDAGEFVVFLITDAEGAPVVGAEVGVWDDEEVLTATTDAEGHARLIGVEPGDWVAYAVCEGRTGEERDIVVESDTITRLELTLGAGVAFSGRVIDDAGEPVADAYIQAVAGGTFEGYLEMNVRAPYDRVFSEPDGSFRVRGIPPGAVTTLVVEADGLAETRLAVRAQGDGVRPSPVVIVMDRGGVVTGRVLDPDGEPVADAVVFVVPADEPKLINNPRLHVSSDDGWSSAITTHTAADGAFEIPGLEFGRELVLLADADGFARSAPGEPVALSKDARTVDLTLRLRPAATLEVRLKSPAGEPVLEASVRLGEVSDFGAETKAPDADDVFRLRGLTDGEVQVHVEPRGYLPQQFTAKLTAGKVTRLDLVADPGATVSGVAVDVDGEPLEGVDVALDYEITTADGGWSSGTAGSTKTDAAGRFSIPGLRTSEHKLRATIRGQYSLPAELKIVPPRDDLRLTLRRMGTLRVQFVSPDPDLPVQPRAMVWRHSVEGGFGFGSMEDLDDGVLLLRGGEDALERLSVQFDTFLPFIREVRIPWDEDVDLGDVELDPGVTLRGRVVDLAGVAVPGALVSCEGPREAVTSADGSFTLPHVPSEAVDVSVDADGFLSLEATVPTEVPTEVPTGSSAGTAADGAAAPALLTLHRGALVTARLTDADGEPLTNYWLQFRRPPTSDDEPKGEHLDEAGTDDSGRFSIRLPAGRCRALFVTDEKIYELATVDLVEGGAESLALTLTRD